MSDHFTRYEDPTGYDAPQTPEEPVKVNPWAAVFTVLWAPRQVFALVRERAPIAAPYLTGFVISLVTSLVVVGNMGRVTNELMQSMPSGQAAQIGLVFAKVLIIFTGLAGPWFSGLMLALFMMLFGMAVGSARPTFGQYFSAAGYARIPLSVSAVLTWPLYYTASTLAVFNNVSRSLSMGGLLHGASVFLTTFLGQVGPFVIWEFVLVVIALAALQRKREGQAAWVGVVLWLLGAISVAGYAALGGAFQSFAKQMQPPRQ